MEDCVILFLHHENNTITNKHLFLLEVHNPHFKVVSLTPNSNPRSQLWSYKNMWMHNDTMIYDWMDSDNFIKSKRYCWFDWDTKCEQSVDEYYGDSWDADMAGTNLVTMQTHSTWHWFRYAKQYKSLNNYFSIMKGLVPFCGIISCKEALEVSVNKMKQEHHLWQDQMNELRLPTCANLIGFKLTTIGNNSIQPFSQHIGSKGKIFHPVKIL